MSGASPIGLWTWRAELALQWLEFRLALPLAARLPFVVGNLLARGRGLLNHRFNRDWRCTSLRSRYLKHATRTSLEELMVDASAEAVEREVQIRFATTAHSEQEVFWIIARKLERMKVEWNGIGPYLSEDLQTKGKGGILLTPHFGSLALGIALLGVHKRRVNLLASSIVEDPRIPRHIQDFYRTQYRAMEGYMNGGKVIYAENGLMPVYKALMAGEWVVVLADNPPGESAFFECIPFLGCDRKLAVGALKMAKRTGSLLGSYVCDWQGGNRFDFRFSEPEPPGMADREGVCRQYAFLSDQIMRKPGQWWACELLPQMMAC